MANVSEMHIFHKCNGALPMYMVLLTFLIASFGYCADTIVFPGETQSIKVKYGVTSISFSNNSEFMTLWLESNGRNDQCKFKVVYGSIKTDGSGKANSASFLRESTGVFSENKSDHMDYIIWPEGEYQGDIVKNLFLRWSSGNDKFGYIYFPKNTKVSIGFETP